MSKSKISILIAAKAAALKRAAPKSRDRIRKQLRALEVAREIKKQCRAA